MKHEEEELSRETGSLAVVRKDVPGMSSQVPGATGTHDTGCGEEGGREKVLSRDGEQKGVGACVARVETDHEAVALF